MLSNKAPISSAGASKLRFGAARVRAHAEHVVSTARHGAAERHNTALSSIMLLSTTHPKPIPGRPKPIPSHPKRIPGHPNRAHPTPGWLRLDRVWIGFGQGLDRVWNGRTHPRAEMAVPNSLTSIVPLWSSSQSRKRSITRTCMPRRPEWRSTSGQSRRCMASQSGEDGRPRDECRTLADGQWMRHWLQQRGEGESAGAVARSTQAAGCTQQAERNRLHATGCTQQAAHSRLHAAGCTQLAARSLQHAGRSSPSLPWR